jgi:hypothetical protein
MPERKIDTSAEEEENAKNQKWLKPTLKKISRPQSLVIRQNVKNRPVMMKLL